MTRHYLQNVSSFILAAFVSVCAVQSAFSAVRGYNHPEHDPETGLPVNGAPEVVLDRLFFEPNHHFLGTVRFAPEAMNGQQATDHLIAVSPETGDAEMIQLLPDSDPYLLVTAPTVVIKPAEDGPIQHNDGVLRVMPGETLIALYPYGWGKEGEDGFERFAAAYALVAGGDGPPMVVDAKLAMTGDEGEDPGGIRIGTLLRPGTTEIGQVAVDELLFYPRDAAQLDAFIGRTNGEVIGQDTIGQENPGWLRIAVQPTEAHAGLLPALRDFAGDETELIASRQEVLNLYGMLMELWLEGYRVSFNARSFSMDYPVAREGDPARNSMRMHPDEGPVDLWVPELELQRMWAFLSVFDRDRERIPVAFLDMGFAPNPDFRGYPSLFERDVGSGATGPGAAVGPPTVGNSFFGDRSWHGTGAVLTAGGVLNNGFGAVGTGGQVVVPMLYKMDFASYALGMGNGIRYAVDDGAAAINISAGLPCRVFWIGGSDDICSIAGRAAFAAKLSAIAFEAAALACLATSFDPVIGPIVCTASATAAATAATTAFSTIFLGNLRGPVEAAVDYAALRGVPVIASAGNRISDEGLGDLAVFVNNESSRAEDWQVIPGAIPGVINCGSASLNYFSFFRNDQFWGDIVDIWAPTPVPYFAPATVDAVTPPHEHVMGRFGATSGAAAYISGIVASMMAANPELNPLTATGPLNEIPGEIRRILVDTAIVPANGTRFPENADGLTDGEGEPLDDEWAADIERRRNLVNAYAAVREAARGYLVDFESLGYRDDFGLGFDIDWRHWTEAVLGGGAETVSETLAFIPRSPPGGTEVSGTDRFIWETPDDWLTDVWEAVIELRYPRSERFGALTINNVWGDRAGDTADERVAHFRTPPLFSAARFQMLVRAPGGSDAVYKIRHLSEERVPGLSPDRFEYSHPNNNPYSAAPVSIDERSAWSSVPPRDPSGIVESDAWERFIPDLTIHRNFDQDWFELDFANAPFGSPTQCGSCESTMEIEVQPPNAHLEIRLVDAAGEIVARGRGNRVLSLDCRDLYGNLPLRFGAVPLLPTPISYGLRVRWGESNSDICEIAERIRQANEGREYSEIPFDRIPRMEWLNGGRLIGPDDLFNFDPLDFVADKTGRSLTNSVFFVYHNGQGDFGLNAFLAPGQSLGIQLFGFNEQFGIVPFAATGTPGTPYAPQGFAITQANGPQPEGGELLLHLPNLPAGIYAVAFSHWLPGDEFFVLLSQTATTNGAPTLEDFDDPGGSSSFGNLGFASADGGSLPEVQYSFLLRPYLAWTVRFPTQPDDGYRLMISADGGQTWLPASDWIQGDGSEQTVFLSSDMRTAFGDDPDAWKMRLINQNNQEASVTLNGAYELRTETEPGFDYKLQATTDLVSWWTIEEFTGSGGPHISHIEMLPEDSRFFFRAVRTPGQF